MKYSIYAKFVKDGSEQDCSHFQTLGQYMAKKFSDKSEADKIRDSLMKEAPLYGLQGIEYYVAEAP